MMSQHKSITDFHKSKKSIPPGKQPVKKLFNPSVLEVRSWKLEVGSENLQPTTHNPQPNMDKNLQHE